MNKNNYIITVIILICMILNNHAQANVIWPRTIHAENGDITIIKPPKRIVSTSVTLTGLLLAINAPIIASSATMPNSKFSDNLGFFKQWGGIAKQRGVKRLYIGEPNAESVANVMPDLILISGNGNDSALKILDQLSTVAPVIVINYDNKSWQELILLIGKITGNDKEALFCVKSFNKRLSQIKNKITLPPQPVSLIIWNNDGHIVNLWTKESAQGKLLNQLGFIIATIPKNIKNIYTMGRRKDIVQIAGEDLIDALNGNSYLLFAANEKTLHSLIANPLLSKQPAVLHKNVFTLNNDSFRLDYYSANNLLNRVEKLFFKKRYK